MPKHSQAVFTKQIQLCLMFSITYVMHIMSIILRTYKFYQNFIYSNDTEPNLKTSLDQVNQVVTFYRNTYGWFILVYFLWVISRGGCLLYIDCKYTNKPVNPFKDDTEVAIYRKLSLGSYFAVLILALANGFYLYVSHGLGSVAVLISGLWSSEDSDPIRDLYLTNQLHLVMDSLVGLTEWLFGCILKRMEHSLLRPQVTRTIPWAAIIYGIATTIVCVFMCALIY